MAFCCIYNIFSFSIGLFLQNLHHFLVLHLKFNFQNVTVVIFAQKVIR